MTLDLSKIQQITTGAVNITEENGVFCFHRFTPEQENLYFESDLKHYHRTRTTAGVKLVFKTDSKNLFIKINALSTGTREYFSLDVLADNLPLGYIDNFSDTKLQRDYTKQVFPMGVFCKSFMLGDGIKEVCVHLPWSVEALIEEISIDDNAFIEGIKRQKKLIAYGDSITQGYDALRPSNRYAARLADALCAEEFNKGIGGEIFFPKLATLRDSFVPDYITVAYGTNDWNHIDKKRFERNCKDFYANLANSYPESKIFAIAPVWRKDKDEERVFGAFESAEEYIRQVAVQHENIFFVSGYDFVPKDEKYFADLRLHPNDIGFEHYGENIYNKIKDRI